MSVSLHKNKLPDVSFLPNPSYLPTEPGNKQYSVHLLVGLLEDPDELPCALGVFRREEADRGALVPGPAATADAVDVRLMSSNPRRGRFKRGSGRKGEWGKKPILSVALSDRITKIGQGGKKNGGMTA